MQTELQNYLNKKVVLASVLAVVILGFLVNSIINNRMENIENDVRLQIANQRTTLLAIAETTARNGADSVTEAIVRDCTLEERTRFESLLGRLNESLLLSELSELERLFGRCGSFYSDRKSVMVSRLVREIEVFEAYVNQLSIVLGKDVTEEYDVSQWNELAGSETKQRELFAELVVHQDKIISTLLEGKSQDSDEIKEILNQAKETREESVYVSQQSSRIRTELVSL